MNELVDKVRQGDRRALARAISRVDRAGRAEPALEACLRRATGKVPWWGITGPPGVGKSTLIDALLVRLRRHGCRIGVAAVDPSSSRSRGALLGDRVRMMRHAVDAGIFIRSLATHGHEGGLSEATWHCARLLELAGYDPVLIETVGVGQDEVAIAAVADLCIVVLGPGYGDDIQLIKAGLLEIADIVVVNKFDLPESHRLLKEVRRELASATAARRPQRWEQLLEGPSDDAPAADDGVPVVPIEANSGRGVDELFEQLLALDAAGRTPEASARRRMRRAVAEIRQLALSAVGQALERVLSGPDARQWIQRLDRGECSLEAVLSQLTASALAEATEKRGQEHFS